MRFIAKSVRKTNVWPKPIRFLQARVLQVALVASVAVLPAAVGYASPGDAIISNGIVMLGVHPEAHLNVPGGSPTSSGTTAVGLRYVPTGAESTAPGCLCEGWGVADEKSKVTGYGNVDVDGGARNLIDLGTNFTATTALTRVQVGGTFEVKHDFHPSPATPNLYEVTVTIKNISAATVRPLYRRVMDWDIEPTPFKEYVTIKRGTSPYLYRTDNNGFNSGNPFSFLSYRSFAWVAEFGQFNVDFEEVGPVDQGALFDFRFDELAPDASMSFNMYYGAAGTKVGALEALAKVGAEAYSLAQPSGDGGKEYGSPNTFICAFAGIGGRGILNSLPVSNAGADQRVECSGAQTSVTLNGSASDPDEDPLTYAWTKGGTLLSAALTPTVQLPLGTHTITLTVTDSKGAFHSDDVTVTVEDTTAPVVLAVSATNAGGRRLPPNSGFYLLTATDNGCCNESELKIYVYDSATPDFVAGPFKSGDVVKITHTPGSPAGVKPMGGGVAAHINVQGDAYVAAVDVSGNTSTPKVFSVKPGSKK